jgi:putative glutamine amidotransferase
LQTSTTHRPLIGLTTYRNQSQWDFDQSSLAIAYTEALVKAGACPLLIPMGLPDCAIGEISARLDGIVFTGGGDVHPDVYGSHPHPLVTDVDIDRDRIELYLLQSALQRKLPFLGICRGFQVINVGLGGSLYEDILDQKPGALKHQYFTDHPRDYLAHTVHIEENSRLAKILDATDQPVNSLHHQGVKDLAADLVATAYAPDGLIEAFELPGYPFGIGVQWHPEWLQENPSMQALFCEFVQAAYKP